MRIFEGKLKGGNISYKERKGRRITSEKVRKAVFDVLKGLIGGPSTHSCSLGAEFSGMKILDLFAGSGMYGLEAISRGAKRVVFVDKDRGCTQEIKKSTDELFKNFNIQYSIFNISFEKFIENYSSTQDYRTNLDKKFNLIFADPPYFDFDLEKFNDIHKILEKEGVFVLEYSSKLKVDSFSNLEKLVEKKYGDTQVAFFKLIS